MRWLRRQPLVRRIRRHIPPGRARAMLAGAAIVAAAFTLGAYVVAPYLIQRAIENYGARTPGRSAKAERVLVNPFTLTVTLVRPEMADPSFGVSFGAEEVTLNFALPTLLGRGVSVDELAARAPRLRVDAKTARSAPLFDPANGSVTERLASALGSARPLRVAHLRVAAGRLELVARDAERSATFGELEIDAENLATGERAAGEGAANGDASRERAGGRGAAGPGANGQKTLGRYAVRAGAVTIGTTTGAELSLDGTLSLLRQHTRGRAKLAGGAIAALRPWLAPRLAALSPAGRLDFEVDYEFPADDGGAVPPGRTGAVGAATAAEPPRWRLSNGDARIAAAYAEVAQGFVARAPRAVLHLSAASGTDVLDAATFAVRAEELTIEASSDAGPRALARASSVEANEIKFRTADADEPGAWLVTIGTGRLTGLDAGVEIASGTAPADADVDGGPLPGRVLLAWLSKPVLSAGEASEQRPFVLHRLELAGGRIAFADRAAAPVARFETTGLSGSLTASRDPDTNAERLGEAVAVSLSGGLGGGGTGTLEAVLERSSTVPVPRSLALTLRGVAATAVAPYAERALGRALADGRVDLVFTCGTDEAGRLAGTLRVAGDGLVLTKGGEPRPDAPAPSSSGSSAPSPNESPPSALSPNESPPSAPSLNDSRPSAPPVELALAVLADPSGHVELTAPIAGPQPPAPAACLPGVAAAALRSKVAAIAAAPFETLAAAVGRDASSLDAVQFEPGAAEPSDAGLATLDALAQALERRPKLGLRVAGAYDQKVDREALAVKEVELHVALETAGATLRVSPGPVDFTLPLAQKVLDEFAARRLSAEQRATIASEFDLHAAGAEDRATRLAYYRAIFDALVRSQPIQPSALARLGRFRAESIARQLERRGIGRERVAAADAEGDARAQNGDVSVPLEAAPLPLEGAGGPLGGGGLLSVPIVSSASGDSAATKGEARD
jgi:hypothetical protein